MLSLFCISGLRHKSFYTSAAILTRSNARILPFREGEMSDKFRHGGAGIHRKSATAYTQNAHHRKEFRARFTYQRQRLVQGEGGGGGIEISLRYIFLAFHVRNAPGDI